MWKESMVLCCCLILVFLAQGGRANPDMTEEELESFFSQFGYDMMDDNPAMIGELMSPERRREMKIMEAQRMMALPQTGVIDEEFTRMARSNRCGMKDVNNANDMTKRRKKRFALQGSKWHTRDLSWDIKQYTPDMSIQEVDTEVERSFRLWSSVANINFHRMRSGQVDLEIRFTPRSHGDGFDFDGPGKTLAHAFFPIYGGDVHMDEDETWTFNVTWGVNFFQTFTHEIGHSLGLDHSDVRDAVMFAYARPYDPNFNFHPDDTNGIVAIYGARQDRRETTTTSRPFSTSTMKMPEEDMPDPCQDGRVDAMADLGRYGVLAFYNNYYMLIYDDGIAPGYPRPITDFGLSGRVDAVLVTPPNYNYNIPYRMHIFQGSQVYLYEDLSFRVEAGYPKPIGEVFPGVPDNIDSIFRWSGNGRIYITKGDQYYRYADGRVYCSNGQCTQYPGYVPRSYPRSLSVWRGLPSGGMDAVFQWRNGRTYFFRGTQYYRFNDFQFQVDRDYPRSITQWWFNCQAGNQEQGGTTAKMMMEADMMNEDQFDEVEGMMGSNNDTDSSSTMEEDDDDLDIFSGQSNVTASLSIVTSLLMAVLLQYLL